MLSDDTISFDNSCLRTIASDESRELIEAQYKLFCLDMIREASGVYGCRTANEAFESLINRSAIRNETVESLYRYLQCRVSDSKTIRTGYGSEQGKLGRGFTLFSYPFSLDKSDKIKFNGYKAQQLDEGIYLMNYFNKSLDKIGMSVCEENLEECDLLARFLTLKIMVYKISIDYNRNRKWNGFVDFDGNMIFNDHSGFPQAKSLVGFSQFFDSQLERICEQKEVPNVK